MAVDLVSLGMLFDCDRVLHDKLCSEIKIDCVRRVFRCVDERIRCVTANDHEIAKSK